MRTRLRSTLFRGAIGSERLSGSAALLAGYGEGFAFSAEDGGGLGSVTVKDADTPANVKTNVAAHNLITQSGTSPKLVKQPDGTVAWSPHNLAWYTEELASWTSFGAATTVTDDALTYNGIGLSLVDENATATNNYGRRINVVHNTGATYALRFYAKKDGIRYLQINASDAIAYLDLDDNHLENTNAYFISGSVTELTDGVVRVDMTYTSSGGNDYLFLNLTTTSATSSHAGVVGDGMYLGGVQVNREAVQSYIANSGSAAVLYPAFEWDASPDTGSPRWRMLVEPAATNLLVQSRAWGDAAWTFAGQLGVTSNTTAALDGTTSADTLTSTAGTGAHKTFDGITLTTATNVAISWLVKAGTHSYPYLILSKSGTYYASAVFDLSNSGATAASETSVGATSGTIVSTSQTALANGWFRIVMVAQIGEADPYVQAGFAEAATGNTFNTTGAVTWVGAAAGTETLIAGDIVAEAGTVATSPIPTYGATVTRGADDLGFAGSLIPLSDTAGTVHIQLSQKVLLFQYAFGLSADSTNYHRLVANNGANSPQLTSRVANIVQADLNALGTIIVNTTFNVAAAYEENNYAAVMDGGTVKTDSSGTVPSSLSAIDIGNFLSAGSLLGYIDEIIYVPQRLPNATLQGLTA